MQGASHKTIEVEDLAAFIWAAEYDSEQYPWAERSTDEKAYYLDCARALVARFEIYPREVEKKT